MLLGRPATARPRVDGRLIFGDPACLGLPAAADALVSPSSCSLGSAFIVTDTYLQQGMSVLHLKVRWPLRAMQAVEVIAGHLLHARLAQPGSSCFPVQATLNAALGVVCVCVCVIMTEVDKYS